MHRVLKQETTRPRAINMLQQQDKFQHFMRVYNYVSLLLKAMQISLAKTT